MIQGTEKTRAKILIVEDSSVFREMQSLLLKQAGFAVSAHETPREALEVAAKQRFELVVIDYELPEMNGEQFMHALRAMQPDIAVIFVSGALTLDLAIKLGKQGVAGIFNKPANPKLLIEKVNETIFRHQARDTSARVAGKGREIPDAYVAPEPNLGQLAYAPRYVPGGSAEKFREFTHRLWKVRDFRNVLLLQGEPGSAFELFSRELVENSLFKEGPLMICDAGEIDSRRLIEILAPCLLSSDAGTLVLTQIEKLTPTQQKTVENLVTGRDAFLPFARRFRVLACATQELSDRVDAGTFNETLYYKLSTLSVTLPTLREMKEDIPANAQHILTMTAGQDAPPLTADAAIWLEAQPWPGNYDELALTLVRAAELAKEGAIDVAALEAAHGEVTNPAGVQPAAAKERGEAEPEAVQGSRSTFRASTPAYDYSARLSAALNQARG